MAHRSRSIGAGAIALATGLLIALPTFSSGATVKNDLRSFQAVEPRAVTESTNPMTEPPLHGTNPHGQGTAAVVDLAPSNTRPFTVDETGSAEDEDIVIGRSRGEQRADGTYHGHVTVAALFGNEIIEGADTVAGDAAVDRAIADDLLAGLCTGSGICIEAARVRSRTTNTGSFNSFTLAGLALGGAVPLPGVPGDVPALTIRAADSIGNITSDGTCQTANGFSNVADLSAGAGAAIADVAQSTSRSRACRGGATEQENTSKVIELGGTGLSVPLLNLVPDGCADGTPDTVGGLPTLLPIVCNADDSSETGGTQADVAGTPYGVRHALDDYVLGIGDSALAQVSAAQSESLAVAPAAVTTPTTPTTTTPTTTTPTTTVTTPGTTTATPVATVTTPGTAVTTPGTGTGDDGAGDDGGAGDDAPECSDGVDNDGDGKIDFGSDPGCSSAEDDSEDNGAVSLGGKELPFTGTDVVVLGLAGSILLAAGLTLRGPARRREELDFS
jgi:hypothetical protein